MEDDLRDAAVIISDCLTVSLTEAETKRRKLYGWEIDGIKWLRRHWEDHPETRLNMWISQRYILNTKLDLNGKMNDWNTRTIRKERYGY